MIKEDNYSSQKCCTCYGQP